jgi:hypothetical protein
MPIRRTPEAIVAAHRFDPKRRTLFVEGPRDRHFLRWLLNASLSENAQILEIDSVDVPQVSEGGNRGRILAFAELVGNQSTAIGFFADADFDRILGKTTPDNVWLTDGRDLEAYVLQEACMRKVISVALNSDLSAQESLSQVMKIGRVASAAYVVSTRAAMNLPLQGVGISKYVVTRRRVVSLQLDKWIGVLLLQAGLPVSENEGLKARILGALDEFAAIADFEFVHGRAAFEALAELFKHAFKVPRDETPRLLWASFERSMASGYPTLGRIVDFLT